MKINKPKRLKTLPQYFEEIIKGNKRAELRFNDRDFKVGDIYELEEYDGKTYTGRSVTVRITHILEGFEGLAKGWCMFSFVTLGEAKENCLNKIEEIRLIGSADSNQVMNRLKECVENYQNKGLSCEINYKPTVEHDETDYTVHNIIVIGRK